MSGQNPQFDDGRRSGIEACITWLHHRAEAMNDSQAKATLHSAANNLGWAMDDTKKASDPAALEAAKDPEEKLESINPFYSLF